MIHDEGNAASLTAGLTANDRLGVLSPRYEDAILGAGAAILAFVTAFYDLQWDGGASTSTGDGGLVRISPPRRRSVTLPR
jgi:hypothetical protein